MAIKSVRGWLSKTSAAFRSAREGNVAIIFGLALIPVFGMVGAAVDYSRANSVKAAMQAALDASALMLSKDAPLLTKQELNDKAEQYFLAEFNRPEAIKLDVKPKYASNGALLDLTLSGSGRIKTTITQLLGQKHLKIEAVSQVTWGVAKRGLRQERRVRASRRREIWCASDGSRGYFSVDQLGFSRVNWSACSS